MIETNELCKTFDDIQAVSQVTLTIKEGNVFGLIGTNGAGKSTFLRMLTGVLKPDSGTITIDQLHVFENPEAKSKFFYISDEQYFLPNSTPKEMAHYYCSIYGNFRLDQFSEYLDCFELSPNRRIATFSKGMKKQLSILLGLCSYTKYLFCDETFDGLDPVMRQGIKSIFANEMTQRDFTPIIASHNLRELEDICDHVGLLHKGGVLLSKELMEMKSNIHKLQCVFQNQDMEQSVLEQLNVIKLERRGSLLTVTVKGEKDAIVNSVTLSSPVFFEVLPLSLEEIFISETEVVGYDIKKLIL